MKRQEVVEALREYFATDSVRFVAAYLFGSVARDEMRASSDVDVGVILDHEIPRRLDDYPLDLQSALERRLGRPADVVVMNGAPSDLLHRILRDGILVHDRDRRARIEFEVKARIEFFDFRPVLARYRRSVLGSV